MDIDWNTIDRTKLKTKGGRKVRIYALDGGGPCPVHGATLLRDSEEWEQESWTLQGSYFEDGQQCTSLDLDFTDALPTEPAGNLMAERKTSQMATNAEGI